MKTLQIQHQGKEYELTIDRHTSPISHTGSIFASLWGWEENEWSLITKGYHILATEFDTLVSVCVEAFGEDFDYEKLAFENNIDLVTYEED